MSEPTLFERILSGDIPAKIPSQDDLAFFIPDHKTQAPVHFLVIPKKPVPRIDKAEAEDKALLGHLLMVARDMARQLNLTEDGYRIVINNGPNGGESVPHLHVHVLGGRQMTWPPG